MISSRETSIQASRPGRGVQYEAPRVHRICNKCWTSHVRGDRRRDKCAPTVPTHGVTRDVALLAVEMARQERINRDLAEYRVRKGAA